MEISGANAPAAAPQQGRDVITNMFSLPEEMFRYSTTHLASASNSNQALATEMHVFFDRQASITRSAVAESVRAVTSLSAAKSFRELHGIQAGMLHSTMDYLGKLNASWFAFARRSPVVQA